MAGTYIDFGDTIANKAWAKKLGAETLQETYFGKFVGKAGDMNALIMRKDELQKGPGDKVTFSLRPQLTGKGRKGDSVLEGYEESLAFHNDSIIIDQLRHAVKNVGRMSQQRVPFNLKSEAKNGLKDWFVDRMNVAFFNQLCGYTAETDLEYTGLNAPTAPTSNRHLIASGQSNEQSLTSSHPFTLEMIDYAVERAKTAKIKDGTGSPIRPFRINGSKMYAAFLHPYQVTQMRIAATGGRWKEIHDSMLQANASSKNPILSGAVGIYNNTILHESSEVTEGVDSSSGASISSVRRAVFCGAQSLAMAFGQNNGPDRWTWVDKTFDYENQYGASAGTIMGLKKTKYAPEGGGSSEDFGTIVMASYAAAHTGA